MNEIPRRRAHGWLGGLAVLVSLVACSGEAGEDTSVATTVNGATPTTGHVAPTLVRLDPTTTANGISAEFGDHVIGAPDADARGELLVFFPGTGARHDRYETFLARTLQLGYHVIGLAYPNDLSVNFDLCPAGSDPACAEAAREEVLWGTDAPGLPLDVPPTDAALTRHAAALEHLAETRPDEGWGSYLDDNERPVWARIATAGHSQGGGHAAYLARDDELQVDTLQSIGFR